MMGWYNHGMGFGAWLFMGGFWLVLLALIVWLVVKLLPTRQPPNAGPPVETPEDILDRRFARGEIDEQTYTSARAALAANRPPKG
jgi:putative membrane protein